MPTPISRTILESNESFSRHSEATIVELANGLLLLAWSKFKGHHDNSDAHVARMISEDGGQTWQEERVLVANEAGLNVMSPAIRRLKDGSLGLVCSFRDSKKNAKRLFRRSTDEGKTWSSAIDITGDGYNTGAHDRLTVTSRGRVLAPLHCADHWDNHYLTIKVARSDDHGRTWRLSDPITLPKLNASESGAQEPDIVERIDGSLLMIMRTATGRLYQAESHDQGANWTHIRPTAVTSPIAPAIIRRIPNTGDLLLIWNWTYNHKDFMLGKRKRLTCAISKDGGGTWPIQRRKVIENESEDCFSYPSCTFYNDEILLTYYRMREGVEFNFDGPRSLKLTRFPTSWLYE